MIDENIQRDLTAWVHAVSRDFRVLISRYAERPGSRRPGQMYSVANGDVIPALPEAGWLGGTVISQ
jgi:hypothetical protein